MRRRGAVEQQPGAQQPAVLGKCLCDTVSSAPKVPTRFRYGGARTECANRCVADHGRFTNVFRHLASVHPAGYRGEAIR
jgi:hypothetical protein